MLVVDAHHTRAGVPLAVRYTDRTDNGLAGMTDAGALADSVSIQPFQHDEALFLARMEVGPHDVGPWLGDQLRLKELSIRGFCGGTENQAFASLWALDLGADSDQSLTC